MHRIVISGCSGGGKSTLLDELQRRGLATRPEPGRRVVREQLAKGGTALPWIDSLAFARQCLALALHDFAPSDQGTDHDRARCASQCVVFHDRSIIDAAAGMERLTGAIPEPVLQTVATHRYATTVFMTPPWQALFATDAERRHSFEEACAEYAHLVETYTRFGYTTYVLPRTSVCARADILQRFAAV